MVTTSHAVPLYTFMFLLVEFQYKAPSSKAFPSLSNVGADAFEPRYLSSNSSYDVAAELALVAAEDAEVAAEDALVAAEVADVCADAVSVATFRYVEVLVSAVVISPMSRRRPEPVRPTTEL